MDFVILSKRCETLFYKSQLIRFYGVDTILFKSG